MRVFLEFFLSGCGKLYDIDKFLINMTKCRRFNSLPFWAAAPGAWSKDLHKSAAVLKSIICMGSTAARGMDFGS